MDLSRDRLILEYLNIENDESNNSSIVGRVFITAVTFLPNRCLAMIGGFLPSGFLAIIEDIHTDAQNDGILN
jgi:hypothetical protein